MQSPPPPTTTSSSSGSRGTFTLTSSSSPLRQQSQVGETENNMMMSEDVLYVWRDNDNAYDNNDDDHHGHANVSINTGNASTAAADLPSSLNPPGGGGGENVQKGLCSYPLSSTSTESLSTQSGHSSSSEDFIEGDFVPVGRPKKRKKHGPSSSSSRPTALPFNNNNTPSSSSTSTSSPATVAAVVGGGGGGLECKCALTSPVKKLSLGQGTTTTRPPPPPGDGQDEDVNMEGNTFIWSPLQAMYNQSPHTSPSVAALLNVLTTFNLTNVGAESDLVPRLMMNREDLPIAPYLLWRSRGGTPTADELISIINQVSGGEIIGEFHRLRRGLGEKEFLAWVRQAMEEGATPLASISCPSEETEKSHNHHYYNNHHSQRHHHLHNIRAQDSDIFHDMIFGVTEDSLYLTNPVECVQAGALLAQLTTAPTKLRVRREEVTSRMRPRTDLRSLIKMGGPRWNEMNVLGQVASALLPQTNNIQHGVEIPTDYQIGITLFKKRALSASNT